jgi:hypothetical protein
VLIVVVVMAGYPRLLLLSGRAKADRPPQGGWWFATIRNYRFGCAAIDPIRLWTCGLLQIRFV